MSDLIECRVEAVERGHLVTVAGEVDLGTAPQLAEVLAQFTTGSVVLDLAGVSFLDSSGLNALVAAHRHIERRHERLTIQGAGPAVRRVLELTGLDDVLHLDGDRPDATDGAVGSRPA
jgi:anti-anti-sigma factor